MWPTIVSVGPLAIQSFGLMMALGIFFGGFIWWQKGREEGFKEEELMDVWLLALVSGFVVSRIWQVMTNWAVYEGSWYKMVFITKFPGLSYEGFWAGAMAMIIFLALRKKWDLAKLMEIGVGSFLLVEILGSIGSFLAGSNLGKASNWWLGVSFPGVEMKRYPSQLLWALALIGLFMILKKLEKEYRSFKWYQSEKGEAKSGLLIVGYLLGLGILKILFALVQEVNWWFAGGLLITGLMLLVERKGKKEKKVVASKLKESDVTSRKINRKKKGFDFK
jgi:prolipoprotein diacylglyceryltransferase